jgi:dTDP-4-dehydrorhamnose reductase
MNNNLILVTGSEGLVGSRFVELTKFKKNLHAPKIVELDILNRTELSAVMKSFDFATIINFAAYTDVSAAENERGNKNGNCWKINVEGVRNLAEVAASFKDKIHFIHISTDMVFSGDKKDKGPYEEKHKTEEDLNRITWYGYSKSCGEKVVSDILKKRATILRLIYPVRSKFDLKLDYLRKPLNLFDQGKLYPLFSDQQVSVSFVDEITLALDIIIEKNLFGTYHASSRDTSTPLELMTYLIEKTRGVKPTLKSTKLNDFLQNNKAPTFRYPKYGGLKVNETEKILGIKFRTWKEIIDKLIEQGIGLRLSEPPARGEI